MKAIVVHKKKDVRLDERTDPQLSRGEVLAKVRMGGVCGSDIHYYNQGRIMSYELKEPLVIGHEVSGEVVGVGPGVTAVTAGQQIGIHPARPCLTCDYCKSNHRNLCPDTLFFGSAMRFPHIQGAFSQLLLLREDQCYPTQNRISWQVLTLAEPLAVGLHGVDRTGGVKGKRVLICGAGPIGQAAMIAAKYRGAGMVAITDIEAQPLKIAQKLGADVAVNVRQEAGTIQKWQENRGYFDVVLEATGNDQSVETAVHCARPGGVIVQLGMSSNPVDPIPRNAVITKELDFRGAFRFDQEFGEVVAALDEDRIDPTPLVTQVFAMDQAEAALKAAPDRSKQLKVQISMD
jgi:L-idonate 5-dehydrogenase